MVGPYNEPPFRVDAIAVEDDTYNVLSANPEFQVRTANKMLMPTIFKAFMRSSYEVPVLQFGSLLLDLPPACLKCPATDIYQM